MVAIKQPQKARLNGFHMDNATLIRHSKIKLPGMNRKDWKVALSGASKPQSALDGLCVDMKDRVLVCDAGWTCSFES